MISCDRCGGECCKRLVIPLCREDELEEDHAKWLVAHEGISLGVSIHTVGLIIQSKCQYLKDGKCSIYGKHFDICKDFSMEECLVNKDYFGTTLSTIEDVEEYFHDSEL